MVYVTVKCNYGTITVKHLAAINKTTIATLQCMRENL